jgi:AraC family 4-hydroxyphenylacetate 3-monooxygenase operon regulatory protein
MSESVPTYRDGEKIYQPDPNYEVERGLKAGHLDLVCLCHNQYSGAKLSRKVLPGLNTAGYWDADCDQHWGTDWHYNEGLELVLIENGQVTFALEGQEYRLQPNDATFTRPWLRHRLGDPHIGASRIYWIMLDVGVRRPNQSWKWPSWILLTPADRKKLARLSERIPFHLWQADSHLQRCFRRLGNAIRTNRWGSNLSLIACFVNEALFLLLQELCIHHGTEENKGKASREITELFWQEIKQHPTQLGLRWTMSKMAKRCGLGTTQFVFYTRQLFNLPPMHLLNRCRLERAASLLKGQPRLSITEIALDCGFSTNQHFTKCFREYFRCPPRIYRAGAK